MTHYHSPKGFTLVELAIVITVMGLLVGGILKGQQMIESSKIASTIAQVKAIESAMNNFRSAYTALPGDMLAADARLPDCGMCGMTLPTNGDGRVGPVAWNMATNNSAPFATPPGANNVNHETVLFWAELTHSGLMSGVTDEGSSGAAVATFSGTLPAAKIGGGFIVGNANVGGAIPGRFALPIRSMTGTALALIQDPNADLTNNATVNPLTPSIAAQMDRKIDDGAPGTGAVQAYGVGVSCYTANDVNLYNELIASKDCGLYFRMN